MNTLTIHRTAHPAPLPTRRACEAAVRFAVTLDDARAHANDQQQPLTLDVSPARLTLVTGESGAGKSTLLRDAHHAARARALRVVNTDTLRLRNRPAVDLIRQPLDHALRTLAAAGLADARCFVARPSELSEGQRARLRLAVALARCARAPEPTLLTADEFAANLDPAHARTLATTLRRAVASSPNTHALIATPRHDLQPFLAPHTTIHLAPNQPPRRTSLQHPDPASPLDDVTIHPTHPDTYHALAHHHYRADAPATAVHALAAHAPHHPEPVAVLLVSMPTLNARWRQHAWPHRFNSADKARNAHAVNQHLRTISRVVVHPAFRGLGLARRLVAHYLRDPLTPCTEAIAAMGHACAFFQRAGMTPYTLHHNPRTARLLDALAHCGVEPWRLATPRAALRRAQRAHHPDFIARELITWARASRATNHLRPLADQHHIEQLFHAACRTALAPPIAYAHTTPQLE